MTAIEKFTHFYQQLSCKDISGLPDVYAKNIEFIDPIARHRGIQNVSNYFANLFQSTESCEFDIHSVNACGIHDYFVEWQMSFVSKKLKKHEAITVDGATYLKTANDKVIYHRDYYDMGQLVYENVPVLGGIVRLIKERMK